MVQLTVHGELASCLAQILQEFDLSVAAVPANKAGAFGRHGSSGFAPRPLLLEQGFHLRAVWGHRSFRKQVYHEIPARRNQVDLLHEHELELLREQQGSLQSSRCLHHREGHQQARDWRKPHDLPHRFGFASCVPHISGPLPTTSIVCGRPLNVDSNLRERSKSVITDRLKCAVSERFSLLA